MTNPRDDLMTLAGPIFPAKSERLELIDLLKEQMFADYQKPDRPSITKSILDRVVADLEHAVLLLDELQKVQDKLFSKEQQERLAASRPATQVVDREPVAWRVLITKNGKTYNEYTERLPFEPLEGSGVVVRCEPEPLYTHPPKSPDTSAALLQRALEQALNSLAEIAAAHIPDCPAHYAGDELSWAQRHIGSLRHKAEIARDGIAAAITQKLECFQIEQC